MAYLTSSLATKTQLTCAARQLPYNTSPIVFVSDQSDILSATVDVSLFQLVLKNLVNINFFYGLIHSTCLFSLII